MNSWTLGKVLLWAAEDFGKRGIERPRFEAEVLLAHLLGIERLALYTGFDRPLEEMELTAYREAIMRRRSGEPVAYITGEKEFWSLALKVDARVLIPRPETELLVEAALTRASEEARVLDLCTGSGCVAVALASERSLWRIDAVDLSAEAVTVAEENVARHGWCDRVRVMQGDLFAPCAVGAAYDVIVGNPPYVPQDEMAHLPPEVQREPRLALDGGDKGEVVIRRILEQAPRYLKPGGWLMLEVDSRQASWLVSDIAPRFFASKGEIIKDLSGLDRIVAWENTSGGSQ